MNVESVLVRKLYLRMASVAAVSARERLAEVAGEPDAVDELVDMASGLSARLGQDRVEAAIGGALERGEQDRELVPPLADDVKRSKANGKTLGIKLLSKAAFLKGFVPPDYLVDGMLQRRFIYALTGQTGHLKTAIALLLGRLVAAPAKAYFGAHGVETGQVVYFVGENPDDIRIRVIGADALRDDNPSLDQIFFIPGVFNIGELHDALMAEIGRIGGVNLVIIDTSAAYFLGSEELSNTQMGNHARMLRRLTELPGGPCVLVLCHPIKHVSEPGQLMPRGGGAFLNEMDGNLTAWREDEIVELHHNKIRGPGFEPMNFRIEKITTPKLVDQKGRLIPTVQAVALNSDEAETQKQQTKGTEDQVLAKMLANPEASLREIARTLGWGPVHEPAGYKVLRILQKLSRLKPRLVELERERWVLTEAGKEVARKAALAALATQRAAEEQLSF
jgi:hypothetical protein